MRSERRPSRRLPSPSRARYASPRRSPVCPRQETSACILTLFTTFRSARRVGAHRTGRGGPTSPEHSPSSAATRPGCTYYMPERAQLGLDALFLQPEAEGPEGRLVADLEETGGRRGREIPVLDPVPGRRRDAIALLPREGLVADAALATALDDVEDAAPRVPPSGGALTGPQPLRLAAHGAKWEAARARIDVAK